MHARYAKSSPFKFTLYTFKGYFQVLRLTTKFPFYIVSICTLSLRLYSLFTVPCCFSPGGPLRHPLHHHLHRLWFVHRGCLYVRAGRHTMQVCISAYKTAHPSRWSGRYFSISRNVGRLSITPASSFVCVRRSSWMSSPVLRECHGYSRSCRDKRKP